jgi:hypothetical protein
LTKHRNTRERERKKYKKTNKKIFFELCIKKKKKKRRRRKRQNNDDEYLSHLIKIKHLQILTYSFAILCSLLAIILISPVEILV